jgi:hypothetical protein
LRDAVEFSLDGHTLADIAEVIGHPEPAVKDYLSNYFAAAGRVPIESIRGWCVESLRDLYRRSLSVGDYAAAMRAVDQLEKITAKQPSIEEQSKPVESITGFEAFLSSLEDGCGFLLACRNGDVDPQAVIDRLEWDTSFRDEANNAQRIAYDKVQHALYKQAITGKVTAVKEYNELRAAEHDAIQFERPVQGLSLAPPTPAEEAMGRTPQKKPGTA